MGSEIRQYIPNAKDFDYSDVVMNEGRIQAIDVDPTRKLVSIFTVKSYLKVTS